MTIREALTEGLGKILCEYCPYKQDVIYIYNESCRPSHCYEAVDVYLDKHLMELPQWREMKKRIDELENGS